MLLIVLFSVILVIASASDCDFTKCNKPILKYYQTLNCTAIHERGSCCPTRFDCSGLNLKKDKCHFNGAIYPPGAKLNGTSLGLPCDICACQLHTGKASWTCTAMDCPDWPANPGKICHRIFTKDSCCPIGVHCESVAVLAAPTVGSKSSPVRCLVGNYTYLEGHVFDPLSDPCKRCVCQRGFNGSFEAPWCRQKTCNFQLHTKAVQDGCAPIFHARKHCCPIDWHCPSSQDIVVWNNTPIPATVNRLQCKFANLYLNVSDQFMIPNKRCVECTCSVPPHLTCIKIAGCQECNPARCNTPNQDIYRELNCTPVHENGECCPSSFDCSNVFEERDKCHFSGMLFEHKAELVGTDVGLPCEQCTCHVQDGEANWSCAINECFTLPALPNQCHHIITQDDCCPTGILCDNNSTKVGTKNKTFSCEVDGATYFEGHIFEPHGNGKPCKKCVCQRGFDGMFDGPWCDKLSCGYELHCWEKIQAGCIPVFMERDDCCPIEWQCPSANDTLVAAATSEVPPTEVQCVFGSLRFNVMDSLFVSDHKCLVCTCYMPPLLTCTHEPNCQAED